MQLDADILGRIVENILLIVGLALLSGLLGAGIGLLHRWYARSRVPEGLSVLVGLSGVAVYLNTTSALGSVINDPTAGSPAFGTTTIVLNSLILGASAVIAAAGGRSGDRLAEAVFQLHPGRSVDVSRLVRASGRVITVDLPEDVDEIDDIEGYDPVSPAVKESLAGESIVFPRGLTVDELRARLVSRLTSDYGVGHVDVDVEDDGTVTYVAVGSREAGIGPTLPPETCAVAVYADPAFSASAGDVVQVYRAGEDDPALVCTAELRGSAEDVVTLAVDAADVPDLDVGTRFRLVTLPVEPRFDREFASLLRAAEETMGVVTLAAESPLVGSTVGAIDASVVAVRSAGDGVVPIPNRSRLLQTDDALYVIARPDRLRRLDEAARAAGADSD